MSLENKLKKRDARSTEIREIGGFAFAMLALTLIGDFIQGSVTGRTPIIEWILSRIIAGFQ